MVSFTPTEDQQLLIDTLRRYSEKDVQSIAHDHDEASEPNMDVIQTGWQMGLVASALPEEYGGLGEMSAVTGALAAEELAFGELAVAMHIMTPALMAYPVALFGTDEQKGNLLEMFLEEELPAVTSAFLEPGITFDAKEMKTTFTFTDNGYTINGIKAYVPLADTATHILVYARNVESNDTQAFIVEKGTDSVVVEKQELLMGIRALPTFRVQFDNVQVDSAAKLGGENGIDFQVILNRQNIALAAMAVGVARASYEYALDYAKHRVQFGKPIAQNQSIAFMLAEMAIEIDATRLMVWEAAVKIDKGEDATKEAYLARQYANNAVLFVTDSGVQTLGGYGFIREYPAERWLRNGRGFTTFDGLAII